MNEPQIYLGPWPVGIMWVGTHAVMYEVTRNGEPLRDRPEEKR